MSQDQGLLAMNEAPSSNLGQADNGSPDIRGAVPSNDNRHRRPVPLRISQVFSACSFCKSRKIKCDGAAPGPCSGCIRFGRPGTCSISSSASLQGRDYPTHLQDRVKHLRAQIRHLQNGDEAPDGADASVVDPGHSRSTQPRSNGHDEQASVIDSLIADIGALPIIASSYPSSYDGPTLSTVVLGAASKTTLPALESSSFGKPTFLPKRDTSMKLARHYIDNVYPRLPFFSVQGFWVQFQHVFSSESFSMSPRPSNISPPQDPSTVLSPSRQDLNSSELNQGYSYFTVLLVLAISASSLSRSADSIISNQAHRLFNSALEFRESAVLPNTIIGVQSLLFLIQYATLNPSILDAWYLIGVVMRNCIDLGLHQDPEPVESLAPSLLETRRRLWWSVYSVDRSMSLALFRPTEISDKVIKVSLPSFRIESTATEVEIEGYLQRYRALQLQSRIYDMLSCKPENGHNEAVSVVAELLQKLTAWRDANSPSHNQTLVETEWLMGKMLLYRPCLLLPSRTFSELREFWTSSLSFVSLYRALVESNSIFYIQVASEKIYWAGLAILYSYCQLSHPPQNADTAPVGWQLRPVELWMAVKDVMFILRALSERWEDGKLLASDFERTSAKVIELVECGQASPATPSKLPGEVLGFANYASLTSIKLAERETEAIRNTDELHDLISEMVSHSEL